MQGTGNRNGLFAASFRLLLEMQRRLRTAANGDILIRNREAKWRSGPPLPCIGHMTKDPGAQPSFVWGRS